ncbi:dihydrolipoyl dehydrogenase [Reinekea blandensis]|uniref:Dihydrolipoyl dehydrogenase n=1 Tax=Reinekea blandensis MED297 TaxID=314283 RepID=A4BF90_9GAMM|nr:dihydrolipoyl dehydrogenase [Reinekea blandensis]EAR09203.1 dihydrolipoamide dehydrogenase [Reinekea sp. MED297] [Reinekea blandensis MED297]
MGVQETDVLVLGSGPGGYASAFRAADLGLSVTLVERYPTLGGVCLNVGCIPSKALLHVAEVIHSAQDASDLGITLSAPKIDLDGVRAYKDRTVQQLTGGVGGMAKGRKVNVITGEGRFRDAHTLTVSDGSEVRFKHAIVAAGSSPVTLPFIPHDDPRVWDSTDALALNDVPNHLVIMGGGIIGLEMATIYQALGSQVTVVEFADQLVPAADTDLMRVYQRYNKDRFTVHTGTKITGVDASGKALIITAEPTKGDAITLEADALLVAVGRRPNGHRIEADKAGITVDERGFIPVNAQMQTNQPHIFAVGDIVGNPMLAHKAAHEGHVAAEVIAGHKAAFEPLAIPSIAYTSPEIAWTGLTEREAKAKGLKVATATYPWSAAGRAIGANRSEGKTKLIYDPDDGTLLGAGIVGINAGELLGELTLAIEFQACVEDIALTIHAHPTLHETVGLAGELAAGTVTDIPNPKAVKR